VALEFYLLTRCIGAEVEGVDLALDNPESVYQEIRQGFNKYGVLRLRGRGLSSEQQLAFGQKLEGCEGL
jgi:alpha-ketoglutarate-dependent taurine dioxygenase